MQIWKPLAVAAALGATTTLSGCYGDAYGPGYSSVAVGYGAGWGDPYWGWYGDYYYPGTGGYVYDRYRHRVPWSVEQRGYWQGRRDGWRGNRGQMRNNWHDFRRGRPDGGSHGTRGGRGGRPGR